MVDCWLSNWEGPGLIPISGTWIFTNPYNKKLKFADRWTGPNQYIPYYLITAHRKLLPSYPFFLPHFKKQNFFFTSEAKHNYDRQTNILTLISFVYKHQVCVAIFLRHSSQNFTGYSPGNLILLRFCYQLKPGVKCIKANI